MSVVCRCVRISSWRHVVSKAGSASSSRCRTSTQTRYCLSARALPGLFVQPHQPAIAVLAQGVEGEEALVRLDRALDLAALGIAGRQLGLHVAGQVAQARRLADAPGLEGFHPDVQSVEQVAGIKRRRPFQALRVVLGGEPLEGADVDVERRRVQRQGVAVGQEYGHFAVAERLAQAVARLLLRPVVPKQGRQILARVSLIRTEGQKCEQCLALLAPKGDFAARLAPDLECTEKPETQPSQGVSSQFRGPRGRAARPVPSERRWANFYLRRQVSAFLTLPCRGTGRPCDGPWLRWSPVPSSSANITRRTLPGWGPYPPIRSGRLARATRFRDREK